MKVEIDIQGCMRKDNLPTWRGASTVYSRCYRFLSEMASHGHVTVSWNGRSRVCYTSQDMDNLIKALEEGDEEKIKGYVLLYRDRFSYLRDII